MSAATKLPEAALAEYLAECQEMLDRFSKSLTVVERGEYSRETLAGIYRDVHTIKGTSQLFGFAQVAQLAHAMETCMEPVRQGTMQVSRDLVDAMYETIDTITVLLRGIRETRQEPAMQPALGKLLPKLVAIAEQGLTNTTPPNNDKGMPKEAPRAMALTPPSPAPLPAPVVKAAEEVFDGFGFFDDPPAPADAAAASPKTPEPATVTRLATATPVAKQADSRTATDEPPAETIRVHVTLLDNLMNLVGELVLIRNQVLQYAKSRDDDQEFSRMSQRLNVLTGELQTEFMKTRMQPIGNVLNKFSRVVRDMSKDLAKKIDIELSGTETELDKTILEAVKDPLTHIVRNAIDHGIEAPAERTRLGKRDSGSIQIKAYHESGQVIIEVTDDGRGLDKNRLGTRAVEKGLLTNEALARMTEKEIQSLIFAPGFSTATTVSNISGRGVGMDVVKTNVERIGGIVDLSSVVGKGTTIKLKIPLTLAIVPALIVKSGSQRFAIPQAKLVELLRIDPSEPSSECIEILQGRPVLRLRGHLLPLTTIAEVLGHDKSSATPGNNTQSDVSNVVVLNADNFIFGLIVDEIEDSSDIVVKSLSQFLKDLTVFSGATIMGDGTVALTLDVMGIAGTIQTNVTPVEDRTRIQSATSTSSARHRSEACEYLLVDVGAPGSYAIPLTVVSRLEEFDVSRFEFSGEQKVIRYRNVLLPVFSLPDFLALPNANRTAIDAGRSPVVVVRRGDHLFGIEVRQIEDVVAYESPIDSEIRDRKGVFGTLIAGERVIVVIDILGVIDSLRGSLAAGAPVVEVLVNENVSAESRRKHRVLIVEDSSFFRNQMRQIVQDAGYTAESACDGAEGYSLLEKAGPGHFSIVLSDIEMPVMDGYDFVRKVRSTDRLERMPMVAVTTRFSTKDIETGRKAGFTSYLEKLNGDGLIAEIDSILGITTRGANRANDR